MTILSLHVYIFIFVSSRRAENGFSAILTIHDICVAIIASNVNVNVVVENVMGIVYSLAYPFQQTTQLATVVLELSLIQLVISSGMISAFGDFAVAIANH